MVRKMSCSPWLLGHMTPHSIPCTNQLFVHMLSCPLEFLVAWDHLCVAFYFIKFCSQIGAQDCLNWNWEWMYKCWACPSPLDLTWVASHSWHQGQWGRRSCSRLLMIFLGPTEVLIWWWQDMYSHDWQDEKMILYILTSAPKDFRCFRNTYHSVE